MCLFDIENHYQVYMIMKIIIKFIFNVFHSFIGFVQPLSFDKKEQSLGIKIQTDADVFLYSLLF